MNNIDWVPNRSKPAFHWAKIDWDNKQTWPSHGEVVLFCDDIGLMSVGFVNHLTRDCLLYLNSCSQGQIQDEEDIEEYCNKRDEFHKTAVYIDDVVAWMPLPSPPMKILESDATAEVTARTADILDALEPLVRRALADNMANGGNNAS